MTARKIFHGIFGAWGTSSRIGRLYGTTAIEGSPASPVARRVELFERDTPSAAFFAGARILMTSRSNTAGEWLFVGLDPGKRYAVISCDHTGTHDAVVKINLVPTVD